jgi:hypothetical protein
LHATLQLWHFCKPWQTIEALLPRRLAAQAVSGYFPPGNPKYRN